MATQSLRIWRGSFLPAVWNIVTTDASLSLWGAILRSLLVQGMWSPQESFSPINLLELWTVRVALVYCMCQLQGLAVRVH